MTLPDTTPTGPGKGNPNPWSVRDPVTKKFAKLPSPITSYAISAKGQVEIERYRLMYASFPFFMAELNDDKGAKLVVSVHNEAWGELMDREKRLCIMAPRDHSKRLNVLEPVPTPVGWTTMGQLEDGDEVFDEQGNVCKVVKAHPIQIGDSYRVRFDDGSEVLADADHLWETWDHYARRRLADRVKHPNPLWASRPQCSPRLNAGPSVHTTLEIMQTLKVKGETNHSVVVAKPLNLSEVALPVPPGVLGRWLGDGTSREPAITIGDEDFDETRSFFERDSYALRVYESTGFKSNCRTYSFGPVNQDGEIVKGEAVRLLRNLGVLSNKHIPMLYLRASERQRRELLAGLMDTDGCASKDGTVAFCSTNSSLAEGVFELAASLGFKPKTYKGRSKLYGVDKGPVWQVCWTPREHVFDLSRKRSRLHPEGAQAFKKTHRFIVSVEKAEDVLMRCITVDSPSNLYLFGKAMIPTHNTWTGLCFLMWKCWKHNRNSDGKLKEDEPDGEFQAVLFSNTLDQAQEFFSKMQVLILANEDIFGDILPTGTRGAKASIKEAWSGGHIRFRNSADVSIRSFGKSTRGLHPSLILCDDVLSDANSATQLMRSKVWKYFVGTIIPMLGPEGQIIVIGTAQHYNDLLHRLRKQDGWKWVKYKAVNWDSGEVLWPWRHDIDDLKRKQVMDPVLFAKEYQNDPRDDASSYFPFKLTNPLIEQGEYEVMVDSYFPAPGEIIVLSADFAMSEAIGADYCVVMVAKFNIQTQQRQLLWAVRERGWSFQQQVNALRFACRMFNVALGIIENNSFQRWVRAETERYPETAGKILGHQTGAEKVTMKDGVPMLTLPISQRLWTIPSGDERSKEFATIWQSEMNAMGYVNDKLQGVGEHDDTVMAFWLLERAVRMVNTLLQQGPTEQYVTMDEVGLQPVKIGNW